jgi:protein-tyrosine phosphatase
MPMHCVIDNLWIGNAAEARNVASLVEQDFNIIVDLAIEEPPAVLTRELIYLRFPIYDGIGNSSLVLASAIQTIVLILSIEEAKIVVCCSMGLSRSPAIVAAALALNERQQAEDSLTRINNKIACDVSPGLWSEVSQVCNSLQN